jgi:general secretion pathway protein A
MYNEFFGLRRSPFRLAPDPEFLYLTAQHREALAVMSYAILARKGFVVLTGDAGTGKTTLFTQVLGQLPLTRIQWSIIVNPTLTASEFLESALLDFGLGDVSISKAQRLATLQDFLWKGHAAGKVSALVIDEAHKLSLEVLEEIRLLGNFESRGEKLLQILLVGQSELDELLERDHLRQFKQRIALRLAIERLPTIEIEKYIGHRWATAGGSTPPFAPEALAYIAQASEGIPRTINVICDNSLLEAYADKSARVEKHHVLGACKDLRLTLHLQPVPESAALTVNSPDGVLPPIQDSPIHTLERYAAVRKQPSLLLRLAGKLGFTQRMETV